MKGKTLNNGLEPVLSLPSPPHLHSSKCPLEGSTWVTGILNCSWGGGEEKEWKTLWAEILLLTEMLHWIQGIISPGTAK